MGTCMSRNVVSDVNNRKGVLLSLPTENEAELKTLKLKFMVVVDIKMDRRLLRRRGVTRDIF